MVPPGEALVAVPAGCAGFDRDPVADRDVGDVSADFDDLPGGFVAEDDRSVDDEVADPADLEVGGVGAAHADGFDPDDGFVGQWRRVGHLADLDAVQLRHDGSTVGHGALLCGGRARARCARLDQ